MDYLEEQQDDEVVEIPLVFMTSCKRRAVKVQG
jgi:hypothetical protein